MAEVDVSSQVREIPIAQFLLIYNGYKKNPTDKIYHLNQTTFKGEYLLKFRFEDMLTRELAFRAAQKALGNYEPGTKQGKRPTYVWIIKPSVTPTPKPACMTSPRWLSDYNLKQDTIYYCGCNTSQQSLYELFGLRVPEKELAGHEHTTTDGTPPEDMKNGIIQEAREHGFNVTVEFKNFSDTGWQKVAEMVQDPNIALFFHEMYRRKWGHYEYPYSVCMGAKIVKMANSLSGGYLENRDFSEQESYFYALNQPSIVIVRKV